MTSIKYKLVLSDFDGTLVDSQINMTTGTKSAIREIQDLGINFSIATGSNYYGNIKHLAQELGLTTPMITRGGSEIIDPKIHKVIMGKHFEPRVMLQIKNLLLEEGVEFISEKDSYIYSLNENKYDFLGKNLQYKDISRLPAEDVPKFLVMARLPHKRYQNLIEKLEMLNLPIEIFKIKNPIEEDQYGFDILPEGVSKKAAVLWLANYLDIKTDEIIGVGDSYNDISLLKTCGLKVAVSTGPQELLSMADLVIDPPEQSGLGTLVEFLKK